MLKTRSAWLSYVYLQFTARQNRSQGKWLRGSIQPTIQGMKQSQKIYGQHPLKMVTKLTSNWKLIKSPNMAPSGIKKVWMLVSIFNKNFDFVSTGLCNIRLVNQNVNLSGQLISTATLPTKIVKIKIGKENQRLHFEGSTVINENIANRSQLVHPNFKKTAGKWSVL